jgi:putative ubiquitin-RnfH superfamily antitoxin RatB of RatAB toxin-antitoxin module
MNVGICYAKATRQLWINIEVPDDATVMDAITLSGVLEKFPEINLAEQEVGIFGKITKLDAALSAGDRVEIYRPITADPDTVERRDQE